MAKTSSRLAKPAAMVGVPQTLEEADAALASIGAAQRGLALIGTALEETVAKAKLDAEAARAPLLALIEERTRGLEVWAAANRTRMTNGHGKTIVLGSGTLSWRLSPVAVTIRGVDAVVEACRNAGLDRFLRTKTELNKDAMRAEPGVAGTLPGVSIGSAGESFVVTPTEAPPLTQATAAAE